MLPYSLSVRKRTSECRKVRTLGSKEGESSSLSKGQEKNSTGNAQKKSVKKEKSIPHFSGREGLHRIRIESGRPNRLVSSTKGNRITLDINQIL